jgi:hypothetical protein
MEIDFTHERKHLELGDKRRVRRFERIITSMLNRPACSIPAANKQWYDIKATYEFFKSDKVKEEALSKAIHQATADRCKDEEVILALQDTSNVSFLSDAEGLGYLDHGYGRGLMMHTTLCVTGGGSPLGIVDQKIWAREVKEMGKTKYRKSLPIVQKESYKWIQSLINSQHLLKNCKKVITVADREADIYELFTHPRPRNSHLLIRATHPRKSVLGNSIWDEVEETAPVAFIEIEIPRADGSIKRKARLSVKHSLVVITAPKQPSLPAQILTGIIVREENPPKGVSPLEWKLLTDMEVKSVDEVLQYVKWYSFRWKIERFHYILKSGCQVEQLQLHSVVQLRKALIIYAHVAYRLMWLLYASREHPDIPCTVVLQSHEWEALYSNYHKTFNMPEQLPTLQQAVFMIGRLGGFIGRKSDGLPGVKNLWRGMIRLNDIAYTYLALTRGTYKQGLSFG